MNFRRQQLIYSFIFFCLFYWANILQAQNFSSMSIDEMEEQAEEFYMQGDYKSSFTYCEKILERVKKMDNDTLLVNWLSNIGSIYQGVGEFKIAEEYFVASKKLTEKLYGNQHAIYAYANLNLASLSYEIGDLDKAVEMCEEIIAIQQKTIGEINGETSESLTLYAFIKTDQGAYLEAEKLFKRAMYISKELYGEEHNIYAASLGNLASLYENMGWYELSEKYHLKSLMIEKATLGKDSYQYAIGLNNLSNTYEEMGRYEEVEALLLRALSIIEKKIGKKNPDYASVLSNLGNHYKLMRKLDEAKQYTEEGMAIEEEILGRKNPNYANSLLSLGDIYLNLNNYTAAIQKTEAAATIYKSIFGEINRGYAQCLSSIAFILRAQKKFVKAEQLFLRVLEIEEQLFGKEHDSYSSTLGSLAALYLASNRFEEAYQTCWKSLAANSAEIDSVVSIDVLRKVHFYSTREALSTIDKLKDVCRSQYLEKKEPLKLVAYYNYCKLGLALNEKNRNTFAVEENKLIALESNSIFVGEGIHAALLFNTKEKITEAFEFADQNKSMVLSDALKGQKARSMGDLPTELAEQERLLKKRLDELKKAQTETKNFEEEKVLAEGLNELNQEIEVFVQSLKNKYPKYHKLKYEQITAKAAEIQALLDEESLMLEYFVADTVTYLFAVSKASVELYPLDLSIKELSFHVKSMREALSNYRLISQLPKKAYKLFSKSAHWFYKNMIEQALQHSTAKKLIIIPDGELGHLPFETFLVEQPSQELSAYAELHYLINDYSISYNYSATLWKENIKMPSPKNNGEILACAAEYGNQDTSLTEWRAPYLIKLRKDLSTLPAVKEEVDDLSKLFYGDFLQGRRTNEHFFKAEADKYSVIHLAMHGLLDKNYPILSSLVFSEDKNVVEDNFLQAYEISNLELNADLVVLSACETGYGELKQGEGVMSLARSFMYAGVPSLVVSLWQVNDHSTAKIMRIFYENLSIGMDKAEALRQAKLSFLKNNAALLAHPAFWSPFIQLGDSRPIELQVKGTMNWSRAWMLGLGSVLLFLVVLGIRRRKEST